MKKKETRITIPKTRVSETAQERINSVIDRDILFVLIILFGGLLYKNGGMRGFPLPWVSPHGMGTRPEFLLIDIVLIVIMVAAGEILTAIVRSATEPTAFRNRTSDPLFNTPKQIDNNAETMTGPAKPMPVNMPGTSVRPSSRPVLPKGRGMMTDHKTPRASNSDGKMVMRLVLAVFIASFAIIIAVFSLIIVSDNNHRDIIIDNDNDSDSDYIDDDAFYTEEDFLSAQIEEVLTMLSEGDTDRLGSIGEGDAAGLISMADWSEAVLTESARYVSIDPTQAYVRYIAECDDEQYMLAFKFTGDDLRNDNSSAEIVGIAACPYSIWENYYQSSGDDYTWEDFEADVEAGKAAVGDDAFYGVSILIW